MAERKQRYQTPDDYDPRRDKGASPDPFAGSGGATVADLFRKPLQGPARGQSGEIEPVRSTSWRDALANAMAGIAAGTTGKDYNEAQRDSMSLLSLFPGTGTGIAAEDAVSDLKQGDYLGAGANALGAIPDVGPVGKAMALGAFGVKPKAIEKLAEFTPWKSKTGLFEAAEGTPDVPQFNLNRYEPPRGVPERTKQLTSSPDIRDVLAQFIMRGEKLGGRYWYNADPLAQKWMQQHGAETGRKLFNQSVDLTGATSAQSDVLSNIRNSSWYQQRHMQGLPPAEKDVPNPAPYGHFAQKTHKPIVERMLQPGAEWDPVAHDKMAGYTSGLKGNETPVAVDLHATRLPAMISGSPEYLLKSFKPDKTTPAINPRQLVESGKVSIDDALQNPVWWMDQPTKAEYGALERFWQEMAADTNMTPAQAQASAWIGGHKTTGGKSFDEGKKELATPFVGLYDDVLMRTAKQFEMDPKDVLSAVLAGKMALR